MITFDYDFPVSQYVNTVGSYHNYPLFDSSPISAEKFDRLLEQIQYMPGVQAVAGSVYPPLIGGEDSMTFTIQGRPLPQNEAEKNALSAVFYPVTAGLFTTLHAPLLRGRDFNARDSASAPWVAIINQTMAHTFWPNQDPIGKHVTLDLVPDERPREIIAVVGDVKVDRFQTKPRPVMYVPHTQRPLRYRGPYQWTRAYMSYLIRPARNANSVIPQLRKVIQEIDRARPVGKIQTMDEVLGEQVQEPRFYTLLLGIFAGVATLLATVGIYGVMAHSVAQRTREIGIRIALGAHWRDVLKLVLWNAVLLIGSGLAVGLAGSLALTRLIATACGE